MGWLRAGADGHGKRREVASDDEAKKIMVENCREKHDIFF